MRIKGLKKYGILLLISLIASPVLAETPATATSPAEPATSTSPSTEASSAKNSESETPKTEAKPEAEQPPVPKREGTIARSLFTSAVRDREPIDQLEVLSSLISEAFYFTEFRGYQGRVLSHQWLHHGKVIHTIPFTIAGKRWRVHSSKKFMSGAKLEGTWYVRILDEEGEMIHEDRIHYIRPSTRAEFDANREKKEEVIDATSSDKTADTLNDTDSKPRSDASTSDSDSDKPVADEEKKPDIKDEVAKDSADSNSSKSDTASSTESESKSDKTVDSDKVKDTLVDKPKTDDGSKPTDAKDEASADKPAASKDETSKDKSADKPSSEAKSNEKDDASSSAENASDSTNSDTKSDKPAEESDLDKPNDDSAKTDGKPIWDRL